MPRRLTSNWPTVKRVLGASDHACFRFNSFHNFSSGSVLITSAFASQRLRATPAPKPRSPGKAQFENQYCRLLDS